ncbi:hypothetical protein IU468_09025 [Nocardia farcinica]|uniref:hypothetical protein n=1 Tax=Nocardia farcinica TaxID=37329 RepID=UPI0018941051|nr:hypothetical protein [Nocardia farcinica]MBF6256463.1 hypothetical protein [Nocardia farcinica]MBF6519956.1 hypothetical protein [Nocardia farcinica]
MLEVVLAPVSLLALMFLGGEGISPTSFSGQFIETFEEMRRSGGSAVWMLHAPGCGAVFAWVVIRHAACIRMWAGEKFCVVFGVAARGVKCCDEFSLFSVDLAEVAFQDGSV